MKKPKSGVYYRNTPTQNSKAVFTRAKIFHELKGIVQNLFFTSPNFDAIGSLN